MMIEDIKNTLGIHKNFPKDGIDFVDISPVLKNSSQFKHLIDHITGLYKEKNIEKVVIIDADLQLHPKDAPKIIEALNNSDFIMGKRDWSIVPFKHRLGNFVWRTTFNIFFSQNMKDTNCGFIGMNRKALKKMKNIGGGYTIDNTLLINCVKNNLKITQVPVRVYYKHTSKVSRGINVVLSVWLFLIKEGIKYRLRF